MNGTPSWRQEENKKRKMTVTSTTLSLKWGIKNDLQKKKKKRRRRRKSNRKVSSVRWMKPEVLSFLLQVHSNLLQPWAGFLRERVQQSLWQLLSGQVLLADSGWLNEAYTCRWVQLICPRICCVWCARARLCVCVFTSIKVSPKKRKLHLFNL